MHKSEIVHDNPEMTLTQMAESISAKEGALVAKLDESSKAYDYFVKEMSNFEK